MNKKYTQTLTIGLLLSTLSISSYALEVIDSKLNAARADAKAGKQLTNSQILDKACWQDPELLKYVFKNQKLSQNVIDTCLVAAASTGTLENVKMAIEHGANINYQDPNWNHATALMRATFVFNENKPKHTTLIHYLLDHKADLTLKDDSDLTAVDYATKKIEGFPIPDSRREALTKLYKPYMK